MKKPSTKGWVSVFKELSVPDGTIDECCFGAFVPLRENIIICRTGKNCLWYEATVSLNLWLAGPLLSLTESEIIRNPLIMNR